MNEEETIFSVLENLHEAPEYWLEVMGAAYKRTFDVPIEDLALVIYERADGGHAFYWTTLEEIDEEVQKVNTGRAGSRGHKRKRGAWRYTVSRWLGNLQRAIE